MEMKDSFLKVKFLLWYFDNRIYIVSVVVVVLWRRILELCFH